MCVCRQFRRSLIEYAHRKRINHHKMVSDGVAAVSLSIDVCRRLIYADNMITLWLNGIRRCIVGRQATRRSESISLECLLLGDCVCRARDSRNRELFEKLFPELRSKRDQLKEQAERFSR